MMTVDRAGQCASRRDEKAYAVAYVYFGIEYTATRVIKNLKREC